MTVTNL